MSMPASSPVSALAELVALHRAIADRLARTEEYLALKALEGAIAALQVEDKPAPRRLDGPALPTFAPSVSVTARSTAGA